MGGGKVAGVRKGNVIAFGARDPSGIERDRERVVLAFEAQEAERLGEGRRPSSPRCARPCRRAWGSRSTTSSRSPRARCPKTSSGKLQRAKTRELYETGELMGRAAARRTRSKLDLAKQAAMSQLSTSSSPSWGAASEGLTAAASLAGLRSLEELAL